MCESALRNLIANSSLDEVLKNRNHLKDNMRKDLKDQFKGWGIWLETVEITEVKISSGKLFKDLQAEFRQEAHLKATQIDLESKSVMTKINAESEIKLYKAEQFNQTKKLLTANAEKLKRDKQQADYDAKKNDLELKKLDRASAFEIEKIKKDFEEKKEKIMNDQNAAKMKIEYDIKNAKRRLDLDKEHNDTSLLKYQIDTTERLFNKIGLRELKINQYTGEAKTNLLSLLPAMAGGLKCE